MRILRWYESGERHGITLSQQNYFKHGSNEITTPKLCIEILSLTGF